MSRSTDPSESADPLLDVRGLKKHYPVIKGVLGREVNRIRAVDGIDFTVARGETLGVVGESGCGKSTAATSVLRLEEPTDGEIIFDGENIAEYDKQKLKRFRRRAQMIFQDPNSSFDPRMSIGESVAEPLRVHGLPADRRRPVVEDLLTRVGLSASDYDRYPHEFSGGQKQRIGLARALVVNPSLIVADEPVSALDVSVQAEILALIEEIQDEFGLSILFISHDMSIVREVCDRVAVMYLGEIVEIGPVDEVFGEPQHPYTRALISSIPNPDPRQRGENVELTGDVPSPANPPSGCRFHTRCPEVIPPEGYEFEQPVWRNVLNLRQRLERDGVDRETIREFVVAEHEAESVESVSDAQLIGAIRREFDLPEHLSDPDADEVLSAALRAIADGEQDRARDRLAEEFETVCETTTPDERRTSDRHLASCHLIDERQVAEVAQSDD